MIKLSTIAYTLVILQVTLCVPNNISISCLQAKIQYQHDTCCSDPTRLFNVTNLLETNVCITDSKNWSNHKKTP